MSNETLPQEIKDWIEKEALGRAKSRYDKEEMKYQILKEQITYSLESMYHHLSPRILQLEEEKRLLLEDSFKQTGEINKLEQRVKELQSQPGDIKTAEEILNNPHEWVVDDYSELEFTRKEVLWLMDKYASQFKSVLEEAVEKALAFIEYAKDSDMFYDFEHIYEKTK